MNCCRFGLATLVVLSLAAAAHAGAADPAPGPAPVAAAEDAVALEASYERFREALKAGWMAGLGRLAPLAAPFALA